MRRDRTLITAIGVLLGLTLFFGGMLSARLLAAEAPAPAATQVQNDGVGIAGAVTMSAYHADGTLFATWNGHNSLGQAAQNGIAACLPGLNTSPAYYNGCSTFIDKIYVGTQNGPICCLTDGAAATSAALPAGCSFVGTPFCSGWKSTATIDITGSYTLSLAAGIHGQSGAAFDWIAVSPSFNVNAGDRVIVTITFSVS